MIQKGLPAYSLPKFKLSTTKYGTINKLGIISIKKPGKVKVTVICGSKRVSKNIVLEL